MIVFQHLERFLTRALHITFMKFVCGGAVGAEVIYQFLTEIIY